MSTDAAATRRQFLLTLGIVLCWMGLTYNPQWGFWISAVAAAGILALGRLAFGGEYVQCRLAKRAWHGINLM